LVIATTASPASPVAVLRVRQLVKTYQMGDVTVQALRSVDLDLWRGEVLVIVGASGSGKSTLLNILGGLDVPSSGSVCFGDRELAGLRDDELTAYRRLAVGFVFQFYNLIASLTARENVELVTDIAVKPMPAADALELVGLGDRLDHFPSQMSGGEQQRVAIARAIAKQPELLLCDEPTGALDAETGRLVLTALLDVNARLGTAIAIITHNAVIASMADRVLRMKSGTITEERRNAARAAPSTLDW
jgi:putative ABC transport system ATP-binding protein